MEDDNEMETGESVRRGNKMTSEQEMGVDMKRNTGSISNFKDALSVDARMQEHMRKMDNVQRLSGFKLIQDYSLTKHCYHTGMLFLKISLLEKISVNYAEMMFVFQHDILETITGDVLYPVKNYNDQTKYHWRHIEMELTDEDGEFHYLHKFTDAYAETFMSTDAMKLFKACDLYELYLFCVEEYVLGNGTLRNIIVNCAEILSTCGIKTIEEDIRHGR